LKILITNAVLDTYSGTETVARDLALEFKRQGHSPSVFSPKLGPIARELSAQGIEVVADPAALTSVPDVIHGHHHPPLLEALLRFPSVPAVAVCHATNLRIDQPFSFPRILRYVAVDERCRKWLEGFSEVPPAKIEVIWNAVDLERFRPRDPLPAQPKRALVFSNQTVQLPAVRRACRRKGLALDVAGLAAGDFIPHPESVLPAYDVVFAKARCALEAMAVGNAVVLCDFAGVGPMVTSSDFDRLRALNFGQAVLGDPLRAEPLERELARYDPADAARVSRRVRGEAGLAEAARHWIELYSRVQAEARALVPDQDAEMRALAAYFRKWNYEGRVDWEREQLRKLETTPVVGKRLLRFARRTLHWWADR
jgi:glycosyl transferase family 4